MLKKNLGKAVPYCLCMTLFLSAFAYANENPSRDTLAIKPVPKVGMNAPEIDLQPSVEDFVTVYIKKNSLMLDEIIQARGSHFKTIDKVFRLYDIPVELKYLAVVESQLKTTALSRVGARGMWQFMPVTAKAVGLKVNSKTDERTYAYKSTVAAAKYLDDLYVLFNDWLLVIAAYNSGPGYVYNAIKKSGSRSFWDLQYYLPRETRLHVKKFIATHYYFEGKGSVATLTKSEREKHLAAVAKFHAEQSDKAPVDLPTANDDYFNWVAVVKHQEKMMVIEKK